MKRSTRCCIREHAASLWQEERSRGGLLALIALDLAAFAGAAMLALVVPDGFDAAAMSANESALVFPLPVRGAAPQEVLDTNRCRGAVLTAADETS